MLNVMHRSGSRRKNPADDLPRDSRSPDKEQLYVKSTPCRPTTRAAHGSTRHGRRTMPYQTSRGSPHVLLALTFSTPCRICLLNGRQFHSKTKKGIPIWISSAETVKVAAIVTRKVLVFRGAISYSAPSRTPPSTLVTARSNNLQHSNAMVNNIIPTTQ